MSPQTQRRERARGRPRDPKTDKNILRAAIDLFSELGEEGTTMQEVAKRAGVAATTLYRRWSSKEDLLVDAFAMVRTREEQPIGSYGDMTSDRFLEVMSEIAPGALGRGDLGKLVVRLIGSVRSNPKLMETYWKTHLQPRREAFSRSLEQMKEAGALPPHTDPEILQDMLAGALLYRFLVRPGKNSAGERLDYCRRLLRQLGFSENRRNRP